MKVIRLPSILAILGALLVFPPAAKTNFSEGFQAYERGDYAVTIREWRRSAERGDPSGQYGLKMMYFEGKGVPQDYVEAARWYRLAAEQGYVAGLTQTDLLYFEGKGVAQDYVLAHKWLNLGAAQGDEIAVRARHIVASRMTPAQIAEAQKLAREWLAERE